MKLCDYLLSFIFQNNTMILSNQHIIKLQTKLIYEDNFERYF